MYGKKLEILKALFEGTSHFDTPKFGQNFIFFLYLFTLKISCVQLKRLKSFNFGGPCFGETLILKLPILLDLVYFSYLPSPIPKI